MNKYNNQKKIIINQYDEFKNILNFIYKIQK